MQDQEIWLFGYGSVLWKPGFDYLERKRARIFHYRRVFYQGSPDHRGTPEKPGRVVTLLKEEEAWCDGFVFRIAPADEEKVLRALDQREVEGYGREKVEAHVFSETTMEIETVLLDVWVYMATERNPAFLGPAQPEEIAKEALHCHGESGANSEYILCLAQTLRSAGLVDEHVFKVEGALNRLLTSSNSL